ncbi:hypothetical protein IMG5_075790 [Ichthyophthirius multifiliis]|uniref:Uncharacterized protein n=1 Tax=Ichthyophthirius multifiliis TaxID=5932 RepID=G0QQ63_ICHMU|nr:hypothetical protein IMG5_075790 [Ichthyophthirius multifiliis]EGR32642.1 hypothetical protein IMG5_075790 [Ichthyophthirius multifiliis]|eukprot:XP_004036628.1 hypothetical protein IMG5_075790 [Ichthyophthirius multifiliis]
MNSKQKKTILFAMLKVYLIQKKNLKEEKMLILLIKIQLQQLMALENGLIMELTQLYIVEIQLKMLNKYINLMCQNIYLIQNFYQQILHQQVQIYQDLVLLYQQQWIKTKIYQSLHIQEIQDIVYLEQMKIKILNQYIYLKNNKDLLTFLYKQEAKVLEIPRNKQLNNSMKSIIMI